MSLFADKLAHFKIIIRNPKVSLIIMRIILCAAMLSACSTEPAPLSAKWLGVQDVKPLKIARPELAAPDPPHITERVTVEDGKVWISMSNRWAAEKP